MLHLVQRPDRAAVDVVLALLTLQTTLLLDAPPVRRRPPTSCSASRPRRASWAGPSGARSRVPARHPSSISRSVTPFGLSALTTAWRRSSSAWPRCRSPSVRPWWLTMLLVFAGSALGVLLFAALGTIVGEQGWVDQRADQVALVVGVVDGLLGPLDAAGVSAGCSDSRGMRRERPTSRAAGALRKGRLFPCPVTTAAYASVFSASLRVLLLGVLGTRLWFLQVVDGRRSERTRRRLQRRTVYCRPSGAGSSTPTAGCWPTTSASSRSPSTGTSSRSRTPAHGAVHPAGGPARHHRPRSSRSTTSTTSTTRCCRFR